MYCLCLHSLHSLQCSHFVPCIRPFHHSHLAVDHQEATGAISRCAWPSSPAAEALQPLSTVQAMGPRGLEEDSTETHSNSVKLKQSRFCKIHLLCTSESWWICISWLSGESHEAFFNVLLFIVFGSLYATPGQVLLQFPMPCKKHCHALPSANQGTKSKSHRR